MADVIVIDSSSEELEDSDCGIVGYRVIGLFGVIVHVIAQS